MNDQQRPIVGLELDAQPDEVAFDLRVDVAELIGGQECRVVVKRAGGGGRELKQRGRFRQADLLAGKLGGLRGDAHRVVPRGDSVLRGELAQACPELFGLIGARPDVVRGEELRIAERDVEALRTAGEQILPRRIGVVVSADFGQQVAV